MKKFILFVALGAVSAWAGCATGQKNLTSVTYKVDGKTMTMKCKNGEIGKYYDQGCGNIHGGFYYWLATCRKGSHADVILFSHDDSPYSYGSDCDLKGQIWKCKTWKEAEILDMKIDEESFEFMDEEKVPLFVK